MFPFLNQITDETALDDGNARTSRLVFLHFYMRARFLKTNIEKSAGVLASGKAENHSNEGNYKRKIAREKRKNLTGG